MGTQSPHVCPAAMGGQAEAGALQHSETALSAWVPPALLATHLLLSLLQLLHGGEGHGAWGLCVCLKCRGHQVLPTPSLNLTTKPCTPVPTHHIPPHPALYTVSPHLT